MTPEQIVRETPPSVESASRSDDMNGSRPTPPLTVVVKRSVLGASSRIGLLSGVRDSAWRQRRLLILCYHSISIYDEHEWSGMYSMMCGSIIVQYNCPNVRPGNALPRFYPRNH